MSPPQPMESPLTRRLRFLGFDPWLLLLVAVMITFGLVMVYSGSWDVSWRLFQDPNALFHRQVTNLAVGPAAMGVAAFIPLRLLRKYALHLIVICILALMAVLVVNAGGGPRRSFLGGSGQPSALAKLALLVYPA